MQKKCSTYTNEFMYAELLVSHRMNSTGKEANEDNTLLAYYCLWMHINTYSALIGISEITSHLHTAALMRVKDIKMYS